MVDSGIHSGSTTQAPSVSSKHGALDACEDLDTPQQMIYDFDRGYTHSGFPPDPINGNVLFFNVIIIILKQFMWHHRIPLDKNNRALT